MKPRQLRLNPKQFGTCSSFLKWYELRTFFAKPRPTFFSSFQTGFGTGCVHFLRVRIPSTISWNGTRPFCLTGSLCLIGTSPYTNLLSQIFLDSCIRTSFSFTKRFILSLFREFFFIKFVNFCESLSLSSRFHRLIFLLTIMSV